MALLEHHSNPCRACKKVKEPICEEGENYCGYFAFSWQKQWHGQELLPKWAWGQSECL
jgi:hypothetical protein